MNNVNRFVFYLLFVGVPIFFLANYFNESPKFTSGYVLSLSNGSTVDCGEDAHARGTSLLGGQLLFRCKEVTYSPSEWISYQEYEICHDGTKVKCDRGEVK